MIELKKIIKTTKSASIKLFRFDFFSSFFFLTLIQVL